MKPRGLKQNRWFAGMYIMICLICFIFLHNSFADITTGLVARWKLDEGTGTTATDVVGSRSATLRNGPVWITTGKYSNAIQFDSINDYTRTNDFTYHSGRGRFTLSFWFQMKTGALGVNISRGIFGHGSLNARKSLCVYFKKDTLRTAFYDTLNYPGQKTLDVRPMTSYANDQWHLYTLSADSANVKLYLDGVLKDTALGYLKGTGNRFDPADSMVFAKMVSGSTIYALGGKLDEFRFYSRALSASDVTELFNYVDIPQYTLTMANDGNGSTTPTGATLVTQGVATPITATPNSGYNFTKWRVTAGTAAIADTNSASTTVTLSTGNATVQAYFVIKTYQLSVNAGAGGSITTPAVSPVTVNHGVATAIVATPLPGYNFVNWTVTSGTGVTFGNANLASTTVQLTSGNATIQANFAIKTYTLTVVSAGNGTTIPSGAQPVTHGVPRAIAATPANGYGFAGWTVTSGQAAIEDQYAATTTATLFNGDATIQASFSRAWYTLTIAVNGDGWVNPAGPVNVNINDSVLLTATPEQGSRFSDWSVTEGRASVSKPVSTASYVKLLNSDAKVTANFISAAECTTSSRTFAICGHLTDSAGQPIGSSTPQTKDAVVRLFTAPAGGDTVYQESFLQADGNAATVDRGVFIVRLGKGVSLNDVQKVIRNYNTLYAEIGIIAITGEQTLRPRLPLNASAYSLAGALQQPMRGAGNPDTRNLTAPFGTFYINDLDNTTWMKTQSGWGKIGN